MLRTVLPSLLLLLASFPIAPQAGIFEGGSGWEHPRQAGVTEEELRFAPGQARHFRSESLYFTGLLDNGWTFTISFSSWTYALFHGAGLFAGLTDPAGKSRWFTLEVDPQELEIAGDRLSIRFPAGAFEEIPDPDARRYRVRLDMERFACDLEIRGLLPPWKPGDGYARLTEEGDVYTHFRVPIPEGEVDGSLEVEGAAMAVHGTCYGDLSTLAAPPARMSSPVFALRAFGGSGDLQRRFLGWYDALADEAYGRRRQPMLLLVSGGEWVLASRTFTLAPLGFARNEETGYSYPERISVYLDDRGYLLQGEFVMEHFARLDDVLRELPPGLRRVADALIRRPVIFRGVGEFRGTLTRPDGSVEPWRLYGTAEYMIIR